MSPFLTEKRYCFKILLKLPREQYFLHFVFSILSLEESYNNIVLQSFFHTHTHTHTRVPVLLILQKLNPTLRVSSRPTLLLLSILFLNSHFSYSAIAPQPGCEP